MKLSSTFAIGAITVLTVVSYPAGYLDNGRRVDASLMLPLPQISAVETAREQQALPRVHEQRYAQVELSEVLDRLQRTVTLKQPAAPAEKKEEKPAHAKVKRGLRKVEVVTESAEQEYSIPNGDIFLDRSAVGEVGPDDASVR